MCSLNIKMLLRPLNVDHLSYLVNKSFTMIHVQWTSTAQQCDQLAERAKREQIRSIFTTTATFSIAQKCVSDQKCTVYPNAMIDAWMGNVPGDMPL